MSWEQYRSKYRQFIISIHQSQLITIAAGGALESFPKNLPANVQKGLGDSMRAVAQAINELLVETPDGVTLRKRRKKVSTKLPQSRSPAFEPMFKLYALLVIEKRPLDTFEFQTSLFRQQLVMVIAHLEAFLGDSIRAVCAAEPRVIESAQKQISWSAALSYLDRPALLAGLVDNFVGSLMQAKDAGNLLSQLKKDMNLNVKVSSDMLQAVSLAEQVRHIIVHNGGRKDARFLQKTKTDGRVGEMFAVDKQFLDSTTTGSLAVAQAVFASVSDKFYSVVDPLQKVGWRMGDEKRKSARKSPVVSSSRVVVNQVNRDANRKPRIGKTPTGN